MQAFVLEFDLLPRLMNSVTEKRVQAFAPPECVRCQIPVPDGVLCGAGNKFQPFLTFEARRFRTAPGSALFYFPKLCVGWLAPASRGWIS